MFDNGPLTYPLTRQEEQADDYYGTRVLDSYRWLEASNAEETQAWIAAQNQVTFAYLQDIPIREPLKQRLTQLWDFEKYSIPFKQGDRLQNAATQRYFYFKNNGLQNQSVLYVLETLEAEPEVLLDPNTLSEDGTVALSGISISEDGNLLAYGLSSSGSDWQDWKVRDISTKTDLDDHLKWIKFSGASWTHDHNGFFYSRYDEPQEQTQFEDANYYQKLFYHQLGTPQSEDSLIYERPDQKEWGFSGGITEDGEMLIISVWRGTDPKNLIFYKDLTQPNSPVIELIQEFEAQYSFIDREGPWFWFQTDLNAPKGKVIRINIETGERTEIIPEAEETLEGIDVLNHQFVASYLKDARTQIKLFTLEGHFVREVELPGIGSAGGFGGKRTDTETFYAYTSFTTPTTIYRYNMVTGESSLYRQPCVDFIPTEYETQQVFYSSKDGTRVPMFITYKKGLDLDGNNPTILYGYGGFGISLTPSFSIGRIVWLEMGGVYAIPNLRGGGEYGEDWHQAGTKLQKQNVFDDFIAAAEWLIEQRYTSPQKLAISGGSNGGLLVGACMTQR
ncbi:MAG: prolyl oligopeptidase family serine peptidase, partial [Microcoleaceae cyanobacterium]